MGVKGRTDRASSLDRKRSMEPQDKAVDPIPTPDNYSRRRFLRRSLQLAIGAPALAGITSAYGFWEASQIRLTRTTIALPYLPRAFAGKTICVLTDFHHGPFVSLRFIQEAVRRANSLRPEAFALVGDFAQKGPDTFEQLPQCLEALSKLRAPLGPFAVPGNHDKQLEGADYRECIESTPLTDLTNRSICLTANRQKLWLAGVDDLWWGLPDIEAALDDIPKDSAVVLLSHNPDLAELLPDQRVGLILSGHTHGGQIYQPGFGATWLPSMYGQKYCAGLVHGPASQVFVSRGLGESGIPLRLNCPPEINLLTLVPAV
jgi:uncharacterized protein